jgi:VWFA-related protein
LIEEDGRPAAAVQAENLGSGTSVMLTIDRSHSMHGPTLVHALAASRTFLVSKPSSYRVAVLTFASQPLQLSQFSAAAADADLALRSIAIDPKPGTTMYDALVLASHALQGESSAGRVIVLITDGQETTSKATLRDAVRAARQAQAIVYPIAIKDTTFTPSPLRALAFGTGGEMFVAGPNDSLVGSYGQIASQLRRTWEISYLTAVRPGASIDLTAHEPTGGVARATVPIPASRTRAAQSALPFNELAIALAALFACGAVLGAFRAIRARAGDGDLY